jgi:hypothetical protein
MLAILVISFMASPGFEEIPHEQWGRIRGCMHLCHLPRQNQAGRDFTGQRMRAFLLVKTLGILLL